MGARCLTPSTGTFQPCNFTWLRSFLHCRCLCRSSKRCCSRSWSSVVRTKEKYCSSWNFTYTSPGFMALVSTSAIMCIVGTQPGFTVPDPIRSLATKRSMMVCRYFRVFPVVFKGSYNDLASVTMIPGTTN